MTGLPGQRARQAGTFDAFRLARERGVIEGVLDVGQSERLEDRLAEGEGTVAWRIEGTTDAAGRPALAISLSGAVPLECQRCLDVFAAPVEQRTLTLLARSEGEADALDAGNEDEVLVADHPLDARTLIEDELLLTLPFAPMHADGDCRQLNER
jgi:uncharacterized protein